MDQAVSLIDSQETRPGTFSLNEYKFSAKLTCGTPVNLRQCINCLSARPLTLAATCVICQNGLISRGRWIVSCGQPDIMMRQGVDHNMRLFVSGGTHARTTSPWSSRTSCSYHLDIINCPLYIQDKTREDTFSGLDRLF